MKVVVSTMLVVLALLAGFMITGCETGGGTEALTITPSEVNLLTSSNGNASVTFTVAASGTNGSGLGSLSLPLKWSVSNPALGSIGGASGYSAVYISTGVHGVNVITVKDQYDSQGVASVTQ